MTDAGISSLVSRAGPVRCEAGWAGSRGEIKHVQLCKSLSSPIVMRCVLDGKKPVPNTGGRDVVFQTVMRLESCRNTAYPLGASGRVRSLPLDIERTIVRWFGHVLQYSERI